MSEHENHEYVTQTECEARRNKISEDYEKLAKQVEKQMIFQVKSEKDIENLISVNKWISGICATVVGALILLIVKGGLGI